MPWPGKAKSVPDRLVAAGGAVQTWHLGGGPGVVVEIEPRKPAVLTFAQGRDRHPPAGRQLLAVEGLPRKQGQAIIQSHQRVLSDMAPSTDRTR